MRLSKKKKKHLTQKYEVQYTGNMPSSESPDGKQPIKRNLKLHNVSYQRSLSQTVSAFSCIPFILLTIDMSSSSRIEKFPSSYSSESAEWKVLLKNNNNNNNNKKMLIFFIWSISQNYNANSKFRTLLVCFKRGDLSKSYCRYRSF